MIKDKTPLPLIREVIDKFKDAKYFNKLDLIQRYNNIWIKKCDEQKAAFLTNKGLFKPKFQTMQLTRNISMDNKQYFLRTFT